MATSAKPDDALEQSKALKRLLTNLAQNYYDGDDGPVEVRFTDRVAHASTDADGTPVVHVNPETPWKVYDATGAHALRILVNTLSHEVQHHNESIIEGKADFMEEHNDGYSKVAGAVINILEDNRIDYSRTRDYRGLKSIYDWEIQKQMSEDDKRPPMGELDQRQQAMEGFTQLAFAGRVKGFADAEPEVQEALEDVAPVCERVKKQPDPEMRADMANQVTYRLREVIPDAPDLPDILQDLIEELLEDLDVDFDPAEAPPDAEHDPEDAGSAEGGDGSPEGEDGGEGDGEGEGEADSPEDDPTSSGGSGGSGEETGEEGDEDGDGAGGAGEGEDGDGDGEGRTEVRRLTDLTGGSEDATHIRIE